jgi:hypothetical protein
MLTNEKAVGVLVTPTTAKSKTEKFKFSAKSTATEAQIARLAALLQLGPRHTHELRALGISHPAARIMDLQKRGWNIVSERIPTIDSDGFPHTRVALYTLVEASVSSRASYECAGTTGDLFAHAEGEAA